MKTPTQDELVRRAKGTLVGAAVGDSMGAPCEGMSAQQIRETYGTLTGFVQESSGGTDDTDFTLFNAYMLITYGVGITPENVEAEWRDKLLSGEHYYRPGGFSDVLATNNLREGLHAPESGAFNHQMWSDGVAMSISAAGIAQTGNPEAAADLADTLGEVSNGRDGIYTARAVAAAISVAMVGADPRAMVDAAVAAVPRESWTYRAMEVAREIAGTGLPMDELTAEIDRRLIVPWWPWADLATEAVPAAFAFFGAYGHDFARVVPASIAIGRDADTIGAIVGSLSGAYCGIDGIPPEWRRRVQVSKGQSIGYVADKAIVDTAQQLAESAYENMKGGRRR
jgi:ADP-ribosylglycohydrolase